VYSQQLAAVIVSELKINLFSTLKIPNSLLRGASIVVAALPGRVLSNLCGKKKRFYMFVVLMK
jgi:hypothetical protein